MCVVCCIKMKSKLIMLLCIKMGLDGSKIYVQVVFNKIKFYLFILSLNFRVVNDVGKPLFWHCNLFCNMQMYRVTFSGQNNNSIKSKVVIY